MASPGSNYREHWWQEDGGLEGSFVACLASPFAGQWLNQGPDARPSGGAAVGVWSCCDGCVPMRWCYKAELRWDPIKCCGFSNRWEEDLIVLLFVGKLWLLFWSFSFNKSIKEKKKKASWNHTWVDCKYDIWPLHMKCLRTIWTKQKHRWEVLIFTSRCENRRNQRG